MSDLLHPLRVYLVEVKVARECEAKIITESIY